MSFVLVTLAWHRMKAVKKPSSSLYPLPKCTIRIYRRSFIFTSTFLPYLCVIKYHINCITNQYVFEQERGSRSSVSNESNVLLDPEVLPDLSIQALVLTVLATLVKYSSDEGETRVLYQYLAEGSVVFPKVFPVMWVYTILTFFDKFYFNMFDTVAIHCWTKR